MTNKVKRGLIALCVAIVIVVATRLAVRLQTIERRLTEIESRQIGYGEEDNGDKDNSQVAAATRTVTGGREVGRSHRNSRHHQQSKNRVISTSDTTANSHPVTTDEQSNLSIHLDNEHPRKFTNPVLIDLNDADSATLTRIPGIAERTASTIIEYRTRLGGFYTPRQLSERLTWDAARERMNEWCSEWFFANESGIQKLNVNHLSFKELLRHPYLNYEQVRALVNFRDRHGKIMSIDILLQMEEFTDDDIDRLRHYLTFD